jgi:hypothetical protein
LVGRTTSGCHKIAAADFEDVRSERYMNSAPLIYPIRWDGESGFTTAIVDKAGLEFAMYDSAYASRMPIVISSETTPALLGQEYVAWRSSSSVQELVSRIKYAMGMATFRTITLKSIPLQSSGVGKDQGGQMLFAFRIKPGRVRVAAIQDALNVHAQDVHNSYAKDRWGELLISVSRIMCRCVT